MSACRPVCALLLCGLLSIAGGCAYGELRTVVRAQFATELDCPEVKIERRQVWYSYDGPDQYKISGCGVVRTYTCPKVDGLVSYDETQCEWVEGDADAPKVQTMDDADPLDDAQDATGDDDEPASAPDADDDDADDASNDDDADDASNADDDDADDDDAKPAPKVKAKAKLKASTKPAAKKKASLTAK